MILSIQRLQTVTDVNDCDVLILLKFELVLNLKLIFYFGTETPIRPHYQQTSC
jgi:hypothetical protein